MTVISRMLYDFKMDIQFLKNTCLDFQDRCFDSDEQLENANGPIASQSHDDAGQQHP